VAAAEDIKKKGVDTIVCISVNDARRVMMLGDGNGEFSQARGLTTDASKFGLGIRSQRYAMIVDDGIIEELLVEKPGTFDVSSAENVLNHL